MSELRINNITDRAGSSGPIIAGVSTVTSTSHMVMPSGPTEMRGGRGRGVWGGGYNPTQNTMDLITIATTGNATDFGDLTEASRGIGAASSCTRAVFANGDPGYSADIDYVQIATTGNGVDFGDSTQARRGSAGCSNGHGGLG